MNVPRQFIECCRCGHKFEPTSEAKDLETCPRCRGRRLMWRTEIVAAARKVPRQHSVAKEHMPRG